MTDRLHDILGFVGGHLPDRLVVKVAVPHDDQFADPHILCAARRRADISRKFRSLQDDGDIVEIHIHSVIYL